MVLFIVQNEGPLDKVQNKFIYSEEKQDLKSPTFTDMTPSASGLYNIGLDFSTTVTDNMSGVDPLFISVTMGGQPVTDYQYDSKTGKLTFKCTGLEDKKSYTGNC